MKPSFEFISGISDIKDRYDAYLMSVFGVIHDRTSLAPGARLCLTKLAERGKTVMIFTNSPKRASTVIRQLSQIGVPPSLYQHVLSSGEEAFLALKNRVDPWHATLGKYCYYLGSTDDDDLIEDLEIYPVSDVSRADFILAIGFDVWHTDVDDYEKILKKAIARRIPMVCANPDDHVIDKGEKLLRVGYLARRYQELGGQVRFHGKPYLSFYEKALEKLKRFSPTRIVAIGDMLETDILGAARAGLDSVCITAGFQEGEAKLYSKEAQIEKLEKMFKQASVEPRYVLSQLRW